MNISSQVSELRAKFRADPRIAQVNEWYQHLPPRDQLIVRIVGSLLILAVIYMLLFAPLINKNRELTSQLERKKDFYQLMADSGARFASGNGGSVNSNSSKPLLALINQEARRNRVKLSRYEQNSDSLRIWLEDVKFNDAIGWIEKLSRNHGVQVSQINIDRSEKSGYADIRATLSR